MISIPKVQLLERNKLVVDTSNPNVMSKENFEALKKGIQKFGFLIPIITNKDYKIADGFHRYKAAKDLSIDPVPVIALDVSEVDRRILRQVMNKLKGQHQDELDAEEFKFLYDNQGLDVLNQLLPDEQKRIQELLNQISTGPAEESFDEDTALQRAQSTNIQKGDVYLLGEHRLMCGDSTNETDVNSLMDKQIANLMVTDPPYGVNYNPKWRDDADKKGILGNRYPVRSIDKIKNDDIIDWSKAYKLFEGDVMYVWHASWYTSLVQQSLEKVGFEAKYSIIWVKPHFALGQGDYHWKHEPCWYAVRKGKKHNWQGSRTETTVWEIAGMNAFGNDKKKGNEPVGHATQKPLECMGKPIQNNTQAGDLVYDCFGGSGTTLIACEQLKRKCYMMEIDPVYCQVIINRWENLTGNKVKKG